MINSDDVKVCSIYKYFYFERYSGGDLDMFLNFVVRELDGCGGGQVSPFSYGIKRENGRMEMIMGVGEVYWRALCHLRI